MVRSSDTSLFLYGRIIKRGATYVSLNARLVSATLRTNQTMPAGRLIDGSTSWITAIILMPLMVDSEFNVVLAKRKKEEKTNKKMT